eukprot:CAMPEP_0174822396 /NCGR_PEP_ID=MMETSP1107-20130205/15443_1 /TAXON_ID=36770 /ORGANISM="Paraphysomonas vestita, Strain GFlagA" /LENGTH=101 /DNA_ID=CAMNT_0016041163 /DNA_START=353 /DNA_END=658 /DNA_ORIENTATION=+
MKEGMFEEVELEDQQVYDKLDIYDHFFYLVNMFLNKNNKMHDHNVMPLVLMDQKKKKKKNLEKMMFHEDLIILNLMNEKFQNHCYHILKDNENLLNILDMM